MKYLVGIAAVCCLLSCSKKNNSTPGKPTIVVHMATDGSNQAKVLQNAIDSCSAIGGCIVEVPAGTYTIGPILMRTNVNLQLDTLATLQGSGNMSDYTVNGKLADLIGGTALSNVSITGKGVIDGNGSVWWSVFFSSGGTLSRPRLIYLTACTNVTLQDITLQNSPSFHFVPNQCTTVTVNNVKINAPASSPNTDGIDPANSTGVTITNCTISDGDDCIAIKGGRVSGKLGYPTTNITVTGCSFLNGHGLSIGSETDCGVSGVTVSNCTFTGTENGIRIKSNIGLGGAMSNLKYSNITMSNVGNPIIIDYTYTGNTGTYTSDVPSVNNMTIDHLTVTGAQNAGSLIGLTTSNSINNLTLSNINITAQTGLVITNATNVTMSNWTINVASGNQIIDSNIVGKTGF